MKEQKETKKFQVALPQTSFPMKGDLGQKEPLIIEKWKSLNLYQKIINKNSHSVEFVLPDGPPYANGSIHIGHALNKILKDIIIKYKNMSGYQAVFRPGWDCHGLPIEQTVNKKLGAEAKLKSPQEIRTLCREEAHSWVAVQKEQFKRLGVLADWENPYLTMDPSYEAEEVREFARAYKKGVIYRGVKPVYWNWSLQTALAEAEVEYHNHKSPSIYVQFPVTQSKHKSVWGLKDSDKLFYLIWTTTPWTLPANVAICLNSDFEYGLYLCDSEYFVIAKERSPYIEQETGKKLVLQKTLKAEALLDLTASHPFEKRESKIIFGDHVTLDAGTGCVHTAPGHGPDDYKIGLKYQLPILSPIAPDGTFTSEVPEYQGIHLLKANPLIIERLKDLGYLFYLSYVEHSYPHCWRTKIPLIFRATPQWFMGLDKEDSNIRSKALASMEQIKFFPEWGRARFQAMIENRPDWCLSRQRIWGVPIPILICKKTGEPYINDDLMFKIADIIETRGGIEGFYQTSVSELLPNFTPQGEFGSDGFIHSQDILDVWFDSGICHAAVQNKTKGMKVPADIYLEGSDQHRGWFNTSMLTSLVTQEKPPFKALITHGFIQVAKGVKMSKSKGDGVDPVEFSQTKGADILRLWCSHEDYGKDIVWGNDLVERVTETYRRLRNTLRFLLGALNDFNSSTELVDYDKLTLYDRWALQRLNGLVQDVTKAYNEYSFYRVYHLINVYVTVDLSALYLDVLKDRLYTFSLKSEGRKSGQTVLYYILDTLNKLIAPILSFLAEEVYEHRLDKKAESVFLLDFPKVKEQWNSPIIQEEIKKIFEVKEIVQKQLEEKRAEKIIGSSLEAKVMIQAPENLYPTLLKWDQLREILIVSQLNVTSGPELKIEVTRAEGEKCPRCWVYSTEIDSEEGVCPKCLSAIKE